MTLKANHVFHSVIADDPTAAAAGEVLPSHWNADHPVTGTADSTQLPATVPLATANDTNIQGSIAAQTLTFSWAGTLAAARLNANVVQAVTNDTNIHGSIAAQNLTFSWSGLLGLARGGTNADLSATGGAHRFVAQTTAGGPLTVVQPAAADVSGLAASATTDTTNASNITSGTLPVARLYASGKKVFGFFTGQSFLTQTPALSWTPAPNLLVWNWDGIDTHVGTAFVAPSSTTINMSVKMMSDMAYANPTSTFYLLNISISGLPISHWLSGTGAPDMLVNIQNNITAALTAASCTQADFGVWAQGQGDCGPLNTSYVANHATWMARLWADTTPGHIWFPKETPLVVCSIQSVADSNSLNADADNMNVLLNAVAAAGPERSYVYLSAVSGSTYFDLTAHPTAQGHLSIGAMLAAEHLYGIGGRLLQGANVAPATGNVTFGNPLFTTAPSGASLNALPTITAPTAGTLWHGVGADGGGSYILLDSFNGPANELIGRHAGGTAGALAATPADKLLVGMLGEAYSGTAYTLNGAFQIYSNGLQSGANTGSYGLLYLIANGSTTLQQAYRFDVGSLTAAGATSGSYQIVFPAVAGTSVLKLPAGSTDFTATGGAGQIVKQGSAGSALTVGPLDIPINAQSGTSYAILNADGGKLITATNAAAQAYTIAQAGTAGSFAARWFVDIQNNSTNVAGVVTITATTSTFNYCGAATSTVKVYQGQTVRLISDGTNYQVVYLQATGPWLAYTPTVTSAAGTITTLGAVTARFAMVGPKSFSAQADVTITTAGTGAGLLRVTTPFTAAAFGYMGVAKEIASTGKSGSAQVVASGTTMQAVDASGVTFIANGAEVNFEIVCEAA